MLLYIYLIIVLTLILFFPSWQKIDSRKMDIVRAVPLQKTKKPRRRLGRWFHAMAKFLRFREPELDKSVLNLCTPSKLHLGSAEKVENDETPPRNPNNLFRLTFNPFQEIEVVRPRPRPRALSAENFDDLEQIYEQPEIANNPADQQDYDGDDDHGMRIQIVAATLLGVPIDGGAPVQYISMEAIIPPNQSNLLGVRNNPLLVIASNAQQIQDGLSARPDVLQMIADEQVSQNQDSFRVGLMMNVVHSRVEYLHRLVPGMDAISSCSYYWGKIDRYGAEKLLDGKPEGTFLLRDSAQDDHIFAVSFRRFDRSLHARIELTADRRFTFDSHDPGVFSAPSVVELIAHYKQPEHCMFFEPLLTRSLHRPFAFSLMHLARVALMPTITYDDIDKLMVPRSLHDYLKEYHYKVKLQNTNFSLDAEIVDK